MITLAVDEAQRRFTRLCHELALSGDVCVIEENGKPLARLMPEPVPVNSGRTIIEDIAEWDRVHQEADDAPDFPDVRALRSPTRWVQPFEDDKGS